MELRLIIEPYVLQYSWPLSNKLLEPTAKCNAFVFVIDMQFLNKQELQLSQLCDIPHFWDKRRTDFAGEAKNRCYTSVTFSSDNGSRPPPWRSNTVPLLSILFTNFCMQHLDGICWSPNRSTNIRRHVLMELVIQYCFTINTRSSTE